MPNTRPCHSHPHNNGQFARHLHFTDLWVQLATTAAHAQYCRETVRVRAFSIDSRLTYAPLYCFIPHYGKLLVSELVIFGRVLWLHSTPRHNKRSRVANDDFIPNSNRLFSSIHFFFFINRNKWQRPLLIGARKSWIKSERWTETTVNPVQVGCSGEHKQKINCSNSTTTRIMQNQTTKIHLSLSHKYSIR